jgi:hypothetical protein
MEITCTRVSDYLIPDISLSDPPNAPPLGLYGEKYKRNLKEWRPILYDRLLPQEKLYPLCRSIDEAAKSRIALGMSDGEIVRELLSE